MTSKELRTKFLDFFAERGHIIVASGSLLPTDTSVLFTTAGMQQFSLYLSGEKDVLKDFGARHLASCQKCFRSDDIEEVGDDTHNTFFEMLGNWSIGQDEKGNYFKEGAIKYALEFLVDRLGLDKDRFYITIFKGNKNISKDEVSEKIWQENGISQKRIKEFGEEDNLWGPVGEIGPCGPCSEIHYDRGEKFGCGERDCGPNCARCNRYVEIWNLVFMEYHKRIRNHESGIRNQELGIRNQESGITNHESGITNQESRIRNHESGIRNQELGIRNYEYVVLPQKNVDTGIGFERVVSILQDKPSAYETDLFLPIIRETEKVSSKRYNEDKKSFRVIADHLRGACFLISEGILPGNLTQGYILRRILRRVIRYSRILNLPNDWYFNPIKKIMEIYGEIYPEISSKENEIIKVIKEEEEKFGKALEKGLKFLKDNIEAYKQFNKTASGEYKQELPFKGGFAFYMYETYGFPPDLTLEELKKDSEMREKINEKEYWDHFNKRMKEHQEISRAGIEKKFGGHGIKESQDTKYKIQNTKLHTATHLLHTALRQILGENARQMGSDITAERLRFDFSHPQKMTSDELKKVEELVNSRIKEDLHVSKEEVSYKHAIKSGALAFFKEKYPERVSVYTIFNPKTGETFSKEICAGPHTSRTGQLGEFKIVKEQSSSAGIRRIKAILK